MVRGMHGKGHAWQRSVHSGGGQACVAGACMARGCAWQVGMHGRGVCMAGGVCGRQACVAGDMHGRYYEIWSMSERYTSYWYAFLFEVILFIEYISVLYKVFIEIF